MESLSTSLDLRSFQALINGLIKKNFHGQDSITTEFLQEQLYSGVELEASEVVNEINQFEEEILIASVENWDASKLLEHVKSRSLPNDYSKIIATVWSKESEKINKKIQKETVWNNTIDHLSWRVDVRAIAKNVPEIDEPVAFFEFATKNQNNSKPDIAKFEMNREQVGEIVRSLNDIHKKFDEIR